MHRVSQRLVMLVLLLCMSYCTATRVPLSIHQNGTAFQCGAPNGPCGSAIPTGITCPNGPGWCQPGYFCGWQQNTGEPSRCLPLPADCGKAGRPCCPSNTDSPHTSLNDKLTKKPFCKDGSYCFYFAPIPSLNNGDLYAANKGAYACTPVPQDCGTGQGSPCCPYLYKVATNPTVTRIGCPDKMFCNYDGRTALNPDTSLQPGFQSGRCEVNPPDCGQFGKPCCIFTSGAATGLRCGAQFGQSGPKGYCANPPGYKGPNKLAPYKDLVCTRCPDQVDSSMQQANPELFTCN